MRSVIEVERQRAGGSRPAPPADQAPAPGRVSLLTRTRQFVADPRRRRGRHAEARRFLTEGDGAAAVTPGVWDGLLTALRRHTVQASLTSLDEGARQLLHMAYLEGQTNAEIAANLNVSSSTVRRRMILALSALDSEIRRAGTWASTILLLLLSLATGRFRIFGRAFTALRATPVGNAVLLTTAGAAAGVVVIGAVVINQNGAAGDNVSAGALPRVSAGAQFLGVTPGIEPGASGGPLHKQGGTGGSGAAAGTSGGKTATLDPGCDGNPTSAAPTTPVGPRATHSPGDSPVTHPGKGGCGPHGVEGP